MNPQGAYYPGTAADVAVGGGQAWGTPNNAKIQDGVYTTSSWASPGQFSDNLLLTNFGFTVPATAIIDGIMLEVYRFGSAAADQTIMLAKAGAAAGTNKGVVGWSGTPGWVTYGGSTDLWGASWSPSDINNTNFGAIIAAVNTHGGGSASVDAARLTVWWHTAPAVVPKRYLYKTFNSAGIYLGNLPNVTSEFTFSQDINTAGGTINVECGISPDVSSQASSIYTAEDGVTPYTDEAAVNNYTTSGVLPVIAQGLAGYDTLIKNGNKVIVYEYSYFYPNGKAMFSGRIEHIEGGFGGDNGHDSVQLVLYSDGSDLDNYIARGAPFSYTTDQSQTASDSSEVVSQNSALYNRSGQTFTTGAGVTNIGAITLLLNGTATVTVNIWNGANLATLLGSSTQAVSVGAATSIQFAFANPIITTANTQYFLEVRVADGQSILIYYQSTNVYANGQHYNASYGGGGGGSFGAASGDLYFVSASGSGTTIGTYTSQDPSTGMLIPIMADYNIRGGIITCSASTVDATGLSLTYGLNTNTILESIGGIFNMAPNGFYWYVDLGADQLYFKNTSTTADFTLTKGVHINDLNLVMSIENVKNSIYFSGGAVSGSNIYTAYQDNASIAAYGVRLDRQSDNRVTDTTTARSIVRGMVSKQKDEQHQTVVRVLTTKQTDTTLMRPGKTIGFNGYGTFVDNLVLQIVRWEYHPEYVILTLGILPKRLSPKFEQIVRGLVAQQTVANPSVPS